MPSAIWPIGKQQRALGDLNAAMASFMAARMILEELTNRKPEQEIYKASLADCFCEIGIIQGHVESGDSGLEILEKAKKLQQALMNRFPANTVYRKRMAEIINALSFVYSQRFDYANASRCCEEVQQICQSLLSEIGEGQSRQAPRPDGAAQSTWRKFTRKIESLPLPSNCPRNRWRTVERCHSAFVGNGLSGKPRQELLPGRLAAAQSRPERRGVCLAGEIDRDPRKAYRVGARTGATTRHLQEAGTCRVSSRDELGKNEQAIPDFQNAVAEQKAAIIRSPDDSSYKVFLGWYLENLGEQFVDLGQVEAGLPYYLEARDRHRQLHDSHPEKDEYSEILGNGTYSVGGHLSPCR